LGLRLLQFPESILVESDRSWVTIPEEGVNQGIYLLFGPGYSLGEF